VNSGKVILVYGPSGNGKTAIAEAIAQAFKQTIYIPYAVEIGGQIIRVFDQGLHQEIVGEVYSDKSIYLPQAGFDSRWVRCRRPMVIAGGELTLTMLDLDFDPHSKSYEAPLQMKATGGVFVIDDFGRQRVGPHELLNRWITPLERKVDYLTLHTGKKFELPFDELVIFSTNLSPGDLVDPGLLRRLHYKIRIDGPTVDEFKAVFRRVCKLYQLEPENEILEYILDFLQRENGTPLAMFQPKFIVEQTLAACKCVGIPPRLTRDLVGDALQNLVVAKSTWPQD
jgi:predicted ATPase with chaperone activity